MFYRVQSIFKALYFFCWKSSIYTHRYLSKVGYKLIHAFLAYVLLRQSFQTSNVSVFDVYLFLFLQYVCSHCLPLVLISTLDKIWKARRKNIHIFEVMDLSENILIVKPSVKLWMIRRTGLTNKWNCSHTCFLNQNFKNFEPFLLSLSNFCWEMTILL